MFAPPLHIKARRVVEPIRMPGGGQRAGGLGATGGAEVEADRPGSRRQGDWPIVSLNF